MEPSKQAAISLKKRPPTLGSHQSQLVWKRHRVIHSSTSIDALRYYIYKYGQWYGVPRLVQIKYSRQRYSYLNYKQRPIYIASAYSGNHNLIKK